MTETLKSTSLKQAAKAIGGGVNLEMQKTRSLAVFVLNGVVAVNEVSDECVSVSTHHGRIYFRGERMELSILEEHCAQIIGRIRSVELEYGKR